MSGGFILRGNTHTRGVLSIRLKDLGIVVLFIAMLLQTFLQNSGLAAAYYIDDAAAAILGVYALGGIVRNAGVRKWERLAFCVLGTSMVGTLISNYLGGVQIDTVPICVDIWTYIKFPLALTGGYILCRDSDALRLLLPLSKLFLCVASMFCVLNVTGLLGSSMSTDVRYGIRAFNFIFGHPENFSCACIALLLLLAGDWSSNRVWIALCVLLSLSSLRAKAFGFAAVVVVLFLFARKRQRLPIMAVPIVVAAVVFLGWDMFSYYFIETETGARAVITQASFRVANDFFPWGVGFATFGSAVTAEYYSPLYYSYGLSNTYGLMPGATNYFSDTFWPTIIGQNGWLLGFLYTLSMGLLLHSCYIRGKLSHATLVALMGIAYLLIMTSSSSAFFHPLAVLLGFALCLSLSSSSSAKANDAN